MIHIKSPPEIEIMRRASRIVAEILEEVCAAVRPGVSTDELDKLAEQLIYKNGSMPAFKGYKPAGVAYPKCLCVSINEEIVHGIPSGRKLKAGDIVGLDFGVEYQGYFGDSARTVEVGEVAASTRRLLKVTRDALYAGIEQCRAGKRLGDISRAVQQVAEGAGYSVVRDFAGHGIGRRLHEDPQVPNYFAPGMPNPRLREGMVLAIEPMVNEGSPELRIKSDGWTAITADGKLSAHFEHSIAITSNGPEILTECSRV
jgi:methionyl aminopeptidase